MPIVWNIPLIVLSVLVAMIGSFAALTHAQRMRQSSDHLAWIWMGVGSITLGLAIWSMHFIGMLAFHWHSPAGYDIPIGYDLHLTLLSALPSIGAALLGFYVLRASTISKRRIAISGLLMGAGISTMHYTGMAALRMSPPLSYDPAIFMLSILIAVIAAWGALLLMMSQSHRVKGPTLPRFALGGAIMGLAISGMHYTAMLGTHIQPDSICLADATRIEPSILAMMVSLIALFWFGGGILATLFDLRLVQQHVRALEQLRVVHAELDRSAKRKAFVMNQSLRESDERTRLLLESVAEGIYGVDMLGRCTFVNLAALRLLGYQHEAELLGQPIHDLIHHTRADGSHYPAAECRLFQAFRDNREVHGDDELFWCKDGGSFPVEYWSYPIRREGEVVGAVVTFFDISVRKQIEQRLALSELQLRTIIEAEPECVKLLAADGTVLQMNPAGLNMLEADAPEQIIGQQAQGVVAPGSRRDFAAHLRRVFEGESAQLQFEVVGLKGTHRWLETNAVPMRDAQGKVTALLGVTRDITARKLAEQETKIAATAFEAQEGMVVTDANKVILRVNRAFTRLTGYSNEEVVGKTPALLKSGRQDAEFYRNMWEKLARDKYWEGEVWNRRKNGEIYPEWLAITAVSDAAGKVTHYVGSFTDISERKTAENEIRRLAFYDTLTKLPNRRLLHDRLEHAQAASARSSSHGAVMFIDLDKFKTLNDTQGHDVGDLLLIEVARRLSSCVRAGDTVSRLGGDEFVLIMENLSNEAREAATLAEAIGEKILALISNPYSLGKHKHHCTCSIGVSLFINHTESADELLKRADVAMYQAKNSGRNTIRFFDPAMQQAVEARASLESDLRRAMAKQQLQIYYQVQVDNARHVTGAEALLCWQHPERGLVPTAKFIRMAEETGMILPIGQWVLENACVQLKAWEDNPQAHGLKLAVNVSAHQFRQPTFVAQVRAALDKSGANPLHLTLELTESLMLDNVDDTVEKMESLKALGVSFALDDFGTGYSSLQYLKRLPLDQIKIDRSFVREITSDRGDMVMVLTMVDLGMNFELEVIAEGVETEEQLRMLQRCGCGSFQGYLFSKPLPLEQFEALLRLHESH